MIKAVLFDVDGVLIDTLDGNRRTFNSALEKMARKPLSIEEYKGFFFKPAKKVFSHFLPEKSEKEIDDIIREYLPTTPDFFKYDRINPHVTETLDELRKRFSMAVVTNRLNGQILDFFKLTGYFGAVICLKDVKNHKPHPEPVHLALERLKAKPEEAVFVGDASTDAEAAHAAGMKVIIYRNPSVKGDWNITEFGEIPGIIEKINK